MMQQSGRAAAVLFASALVLVSWCPQTGRCAEHGRVINGCDLHQGPCEQTDGDLRIVLDIQPRPVRAMTDLQFTVTVTRRGAAFDAASVSLDLSMPGMFMGRNRPVLTGSGRGVYAGTGAIPRCMSGQRLWKAAVLVSGSGENGTAAFLFEVR